MRARRDPITMIPLVFLKSRTMYKQICSFSHWVGIRYPSISLYLNVYPPILTYIYEKEGKFPLIQTVLPEFQFQTLRHTKRQTVQQKSKHRFLLLLLFLVLCLSRPGTGLILPLECSSPKAPIRILLYQSRMHLYNLCNNSLLHFHNTDTQAFRLEILVGNFYISYFVLLFLFNMEFEKRDAEAPLFFNYFFVNNSAAGVTKPASPCSSDGMIIFVAFPSAAFSKASRLFMVNTA